MNKKNENKLFKLFPTLFPNGRNVKTIESFMCYGFEVGDGWYNLVECLSSSINNYITHNDIGDITVQQVKEKFGGLRYYVSGGNDVIFNLINLIEELSFTICEDCGNIGTLRTERSWQRTLCDICNKTENDKLTEMQKDIQKRLKNRKV